MQHSASLKCLVIGHLVIDYVVKNRINIRRALGGAAAYCSLALRKYGAEVSIVSKVGEDFPNEYLLFLARNGINISFIKIAKGKRTTSYKLEYFNSERQLTIMGLCEPILPQDVPFDLSPYSFIHLGSVAREIPLITVKSIANKYTGVISVDLQGYVRSFKNSKVVLEHNSEAMEVLKYVHIVHADNNEASVICKSNDVIEMCLELQSHGPRIVIISLGRNGAYLGYESEVYYIPAAKPRIIVDETGAGDVYTAIFTAHYVITGDVFEAIALAASAVSFLVEDVGFSGLVDKVKMYERIQSVKAGIKKVA